MSQIYKNNNAIGPSPPNVPTSFVTDDGSAVPALNILNIVGVDSPENDVDGIFTRANPNGSNNLEIVLSNRVSGTVVTVGATTATVMSFTPPLLDGVYDFTINIVAFDDISDIGSTYQMLGAIKSIAGVLTTIGTPVRTMRGDAQFDVTQVDVSIFGATIIVTVLGLAGETIRWTGLMTYLFGGA